MNISVIPDRIEAGTFCVAACLNGGNLKIKNFEPKIINTEINLLKKIGAKIKTTKNTIQIIQTKLQQNINSLNPTFNCIDFINNLNIHLFNAGWCIWIVNNCATVIIWII